MSFLIDNQISLNLWLMVAVLVLLFCTVFLLGMCFSLNRKIKENLKVSASLYRKANENFEEKITNHAFALKEDLLNNVDYLIEEKVLSKFEDDSSSMDAILLVLNKISKSLPELVEANSREKNKIHDLAKLFINKISFMQMTFLHMDESTKGLKQLKYASEQLVTELKNFGYEVPVLINSVYQDGLNINVNFVNSDTVPRGSRIITNVQKPAIYYNGEMIQLAEVTVTQNMDYSDENSNLD